MQLQFYIREEGARQSGLQLIVPYSLLTPVCSTVLPGTYEPVHTVGLQYVYCSTIYYWLLASTYYSSTYNYYVYSSSIRVLYTLCFLPVIPLALDCTVPGHVRYQVLLP